ncbi:MAG: NFACT family protein [Lachnospiraceae bacterium]|nr:NFACT family protein [Lachnospiraceae bacterium]
MALDGTTISALTVELKNELLNSHITKISQPEKDEILITLNSRKEVTDENGETKLQRFQKHLSISVNPSLPLIYLSDTKRPAPLEAPTFCMVLRKHIGNGEIIDISQPGLERIIIITVEHLNEMGDRVRVKLISELMGKHSNIILCDEEDNIIDSIKHITLMVSSVREVLPGKKYFIPNTLEKQDPFEISEDDFLEILKPEEDVNRLIYNSLTGISPLIARETIFRTSLNLGHHLGDNAGELDLTAKKALYESFSSLMSLIKSENFSPEIIYKKDKPKDFSCLHLKQYDSLENFHSKSFSSVSEMLFDFYAEKNAYTRIREKSATLRHATTTALERNYKKFDLQNNQMNDTFKKDKFMHYGELINTYGYTLKGGEEFLECVDYLTNETVKIPLDSTKNAAWNAKHYFERYAKLKRTYEALQTQIEDTKAEIEHLESIAESIETAMTEADLNQIKAELSEYGYMKKVTERTAKGKKKKRTNEKAAPLHYISSDGFHIYVGKNNFQNDELTFKFASNGDWWFHAKHAPGSHVILKTDGNEPTDRAFEEAAACAAFYSKLKDTTKADIDYVQKKHVKKPNASKPGFVVYYTNFSMTVTPGLDGLTLV